MKIIKPLLSLCLITLFACAGKKDEGVDLSLRLPEGKTFTYNTDMVIEQTANDQKAVTVFKMNLSLKALPAGDSSKHIQAIYTRLASQEKTPGTDLKADTEEPLKDSGLGLTTPQQIMSTLFQNMKGKGFTINLNTKDSIVSITGLAETGNAIAASLNLPQDEKNAVLGVYSQKFSEAVLKELLMAGFSVYPAGKVKEGEQWGKVSAIKVMSTINMDVHTIYILKELKKNTAIVEVTSQMKTGNVTGTQTGTVTIGLDTGLIWGAEFDQQLKGEIVAGSKIKISGSAL